MHLRLSLRDKNVSADERLTSIYKGLRPSITQEMSRRVGTPSVFKLSVRIMVVGVWTAMFGLLLLVLATRALSAFPTDGGRRGYLPGVGFAALVLQAISLANVGGAATVAIGGVTLSVGGLLIVSTGRRR